ncbi:maleylpyruvate isomerase family mycothiol-dependent enzyme [Actinomadura sp. DC4]|uniref:maleylpyruvate isomerase family mycothiol-dependent enzyme n=1 Tax=Actinomadura sp. DC4 TaxID=3055069 RepID=UPI0025AF4674|nr:maleylpyruvate isomerase family mycothiol-dependent enzyme [Actinomadura sp. DC4]MDN3352110.1 maleylpyruvate isomerase family mycothiol-dependent enzyme [Actinomadura sp. DC4]
MSDRADETIKALRSGHDELAALVRGFTAEDLARPSGASEWDVSQVLSHLGSGAEIALAGLEGALEGTGDPGGDFNKNVWARWDAMSREERAEGFLAASETLTSRYEALDDETRDDLRIDLGFLPAPVDVATAGGLRLNELAHHAWDVKVAFDPAATLAPEATPLMFAQSEMLIGFLGRAAELEGRPVSLAVNTTSPERSFGLEVGETVAVTEVPGSPDAVLTAPAEWWLRLTAGRHAPEHTPAAVELSGDTITLDDLRRVFPGF